MDRFLGIDIGGTKTLLATLSEDGHILQSRHFPTPQSYEEFLHELTSNLQELEVTDAKACCIGIPGHIDREKGVVFALGNLPWRDKPIRDDVSDLISGKKVIIENDARLAGLSEAQLIKDQYKSVLFLTISTGIGGALIEDGQIVNALRDMEMGLMPLWHGDGFVYWEKFASGRAVVEQFGKKAADIEDPETWHKVADNIAYGLAAVCSVLQPEVVVLGGSVGAHADKFGNFVKDFLTQHLHPVVRQPKAILPARRPAEAVIFGCYELLKQKN
ncbi:MAG TPA: ROK family protein [Candidatus Saccharimonadales bacterium]|nr:ROK family protein [Candidatus Saccharimonadales bacterium]